MYILRVFAISSTMNSQNIIAFSLSSNRKCPFLRQLRASHQEVWE